MAGLCEGGNEPPGSLKASKRRGRPHLRWIDGVEEDARKLGCKNWKAATQDRDGWRQLLREAQAHQGL
ncbi:hypothetical protein ANN_26884 [Periplaneta americana]|uniref:Uncharacterized protein n=1 Tax=Periplaneta americana TaxID=6978 RepID=A0ABQ8RX01_PERAM|nr:hypothetical protein ANN_26884 [Periplaneta americana]